ncbi:single-stranded DNA-binding protein [Bifidobacterium vansinderenii]|uniref:Single-stranded DNA-binding protein n=1 Tax=Bifidobacterium vansinderenii TaxID=1984871 RepID=A0A229W190_9BIFI|nr:single-stranded DNA-binding protein [Bifidobacterium vansinderenii]OXN01627.1 single-stranded DNA-binding protein [Bifidobacterium vansinderenii]
MANDILVTVVGNLTADPEIRTIPSGSTVVNFTVASTPSRYDSRSGQWEDGETTFLRCSAWNGQKRTLATNIVQSLSKGQRVVAQGYMNQHDYTGNDGVTRTSIELRVTAIGPDLSTQIAVCERNPKPQQQPQAAQQQSGYTGGFAGAARNRQQPQSQAGEESQEPWAAGATYGSGYGEEPEF